MRLEPRAKGGAGQQWCVIITFKSVDGKLRSEQSNETFSAVPWLFFLYIVLTFESPDEILWCDHSNEASSAVLSHDAIRFVHSCNFWVCWWIPMVLPFKRNLFGSTFTRTFHTKVWILWKTEILWCDLPRGYIFCFLTVSQNGMSNFYSIWLWRLLGAKGLKGGITFLSPSALPSKPLNSVS